MLFFLATAAYAMGGAGTGGDQKGGGLSIIFPLLAIMVIFYFLLIRPQQRAEKKRKAMLAELRKGDRVITAGGIRGTVTKVYEKDKIVVVNIAPNVEVEVALPKIEASAHPGDALPGHTDEDKGKKEDKVGRTGEGKSPRRPRRK